MKSRLSLNHLGKELVGEGFLEQITDAFQKITIVSVTDLEGKLIYINDKFCETSGYSEEELIGQPHSIINSGLHDSKFFQSLWECIHAGRLWQGEIKNRRKDGSFYWIDTSILPVKDPKGEITGFTSLSFDITEKKEASARLIQASKLSSLGEATAKIAHDLNNPLSVILGMTQLLIRRGELNPKSLDLSQKILKAGERMNRLIQQMKKQSRNSAEDPKQVLFVDELILNSMILLESSIAQNNIQLKMKLDQGRIPIFGDLSQIESVLQNLITNSIDAFNSPHSPLAPDAEKSISLEVTREGAQAVILFEDNAGGIPESVQKHMFDAFYTTKEAGKGTGLGLSIVKTIIQEHQGSIHLNSEIGKGTQFKIVFPEYQGRVESPLSNGPAGASAGDENEASRLIKIA